MTIPLKYNTAGQVIPLGYFVDSTDGNTEETALTIANTDIKLWKSGATTLANKNVGGGTHISNGIYYCTLDATDTNTYGPMVAFVHVAGALSIRVECIVMEADAYDALYAASGTGVIESDLRQIGGVAQSATDLKDFADAGYDPITNKVQGVVLVDTTTTNTDMVAAAPTAIAIADQVWDEVASGHVAAGSFGAQCGTDIDAILVDTAEIGTAGAGLTDLGGMSTTMKGQVNAEVDGALNTAIPGTPTANSINERIAAIDDLTQAAGSGDLAAILVDTGTTLNTHLTDIKGATFAGATDSLEAIRDRGDTAWTTGAGGSDRLLMVDTTIATLASQTSFTLTAGSADDDAYNNCTIVIEDVSTATQKAVGLISDYTGATKTVTLKYDPAIFTIAATDKVYILAENSLKSTAANRQLDVTATGAAGIDWGNVENPATAVDLSATDIQLCDTITTYTGNTLQTADHTANISAILTDTGTTLDNHLTDIKGTGFAKDTHSLPQCLTATGFSTHNAAAVWSVATRVLTANTNLNDPTAAVIADAVWDEAASGHVGAGSFGVQCGTDIDAILVDTADMQPKLGTPAGADISADIAAIQADTDDVQTRLPAALVTGRMSSDAVAISGSTAAADNLEASAETIVVGAAAAGTLSTTQMTTDLTEATDDHYNGRIIIWTSGVLQNQATDITDYTGATKLLTFTAVTEAPSAADTFVIV